jgi:hypothetical protein
LSLARGDRSLQEELDWALARLARAGFKVRSKVRLLVDPNLDIMGYAKKEGGVQHVVISDWALHSDMLGGLLLHELAHIYHRERHSPSHRAKVVDAIIAEFAQSEGLNSRETGYIVEAFSHLQNIMVDDIVFASMEESERIQVKGFFAGWITMAPSGYPLTDAAALVRNAFAVASLRRHDLLTEEFSTRGQMLADQLGRRVQQKYAAIRDFLVESDPNVTEAAFYDAFASYLGLLLSLLREGANAEEFR